MSAKPLPSSLLAALEEFAGEHAFVLLTREAMHATTEAPGIVDYLMTALCLALRRLRSDERVVCILAVTEQLQRCMDVDDPPSVPRGVN